MKENEKYFVSISMNDLSYPIKIGIKSRAEGESTITNLTIKTEIEKGYEPQVENNVISIITDRKNYVGPIQLSNKLISYFKSINANKIFINFKYPFFMEKISPFNEQKQLMKYHCEFTVKKNSSDEYIKHYKIEIPIVIEEYFASGIQNEIMELPLKIVVETEGFESLFTEDIIQLVEKIVLESNIIGNPNGDDLKLLLVKKIKSELFEKCNVERCSVKIVNQKMLYSYSVEVTSEVEQKENELNYKNEFLFI